MTDMTITDEDRKKMTALRCVMKPLGLNLDDVPDDMLMQAIAADVNLHQALIVLIDALEMTMASLSAFIAENQAAIDSLEFRVRSSGFMDDTSNSELETGNWEPETGNRKRL